ncbi:MAG: nucleoside hydrolase [Iamia sp.]
MADFPSLDVDRRRELLAPPEGPVDVVIDTDVTNEIDDQFALVWAALRPDRIRIRGLHACPYALSPELVRSGALLTELDQRRIEGTLDQLGITVDQIPELTPAEGVERARAELDSLCGRLDLDTALVRTGADRFLPSEAEPVVSEATEHLIELARASTDPLQVIAIGAATNVASALLAAPDLVEQIVVTWTSAHPSFWPFANASYNLAQDLYSVRVVLDSGVPLVYLPGYYVGEKIRVSRPEMVDLVKGRGPLGDYLFELYDGHPLTGEHHAHSKVLWDMVNVAWLLDPGWFTTHLTPTPQLGADLHWQHDLDRHEMREAVDCDRDAMVADLAACLDRAADGLAPPT